mgnify:FL=1
MFRIFAASTLATALLTGAAIGQDAPEPVDLLSFAQGVLPVSVSTGGQDLRTDLNHALAAIDGNPVRYGATPRPGDATTTVAMVLALPALTVFDRFAVPDVLETPSPSQTFFQTVTVLGSATGPDGPFTPLASATLTAHDGRGQVTELTLTPDQPPVQWVILRLEGGLDIQTDATFFEFSEIIGNGQQEAVAPSARFTGVWDGRGVDIELAQDGVTVTGCYDDTGLLTGTVDGTALRALGANDAGIPSQFVLIVDPAGDLRGVRSTNGAPFRVYDGAPSTGGPDCAEPAEPTGLGCGDTVYGIGFDFDSDVIRPGSAPVLDDLFAGLAGDPATEIRIIGHSSSEGAADYNRDLSQRRAASVVAALVARGLDAGRMTALGRGEDDPIASNDDEAGRSLNRRVEISCG